jgi:diguanylate cyclase (GGDEF)-like protein
MGAARWFKSDDGSFSAGRAFGALLFLAVASGLVVGAIASSLGADFWLTALLVAAVNALLALGVVVSPLARGYEDSLKERRERPRPTAPITVDALTHIPNRRGITASLLDAMAYANRYGHPLSVAMVQLDLLEELNKRLTRKAGDKALQAVAAVFTETLRMPDRAGRYNNEDFLVILPNTTIKNATKIAERIREGVESADCSYNDEKIPVTVSIGASQYRKGEDLERFLTRVDKALAAAMNSGRNRVATDRPAA